MSTTQVSALTGLTLRQLQWMDERGYMTPTQSKGCRDWSHEDLERLMLFAALRNKGLATRVIYSLLPKTLPAWWEWALVRWGTIRFFDSVKDLAEAADLMGGPVIVIKKATGRVSNASR